MLIETEKFTHYNFVENLIIENFNFKDRVISAPTWEQIKKWFRERGYFSTIKISPYAFYYGSIGMHKTIDLAQEDIYEEARETLILKLIEIYENGKKNR